MAQVRAVTAYIYKHPTFARCANGGLSERFDEVLVEHPRGNYTIDTDNPPENAVRIEHRGRSYFAAVPLKETPAGHTDWMAGGAIIDSSDSRFHELTNGAPAHLHDRCETWAAYDALTR